MRVEMKAKTDVFGYGSFSQHSCYTWTPWWSIYQWMDFSHLTCSYECLSDLGCTLPKRLIMNAFHERKSFARRWSSAVGGYGWDSAKRNEETWRWSIRTHLMLRLTRFRQKTSVWFSYCDVASQATRCGQPDEKSSLVVTAHRHGMSSSMRQPEHGDSSSFVVHVQYGGATKDIEVICPLRTLWVKQSTVGP